MAYGRYKWKTRHGRSSVRTGPAIVTRIERSTLGGYYAEACIRKASSIKRSCVWGPPARSPQSALAKALKRLAGLVARRHSGRAWPGSFK